MAFVIKNRITLVRKIPLKREPKSSECDPGDTASKKQMYDAFKQHHTKTLAWKYSSGRANQQNQVCCCLSRSGKYKSMRTEG